MHGATIKIGLPVEEPVILVNLLVNQTSTSSTGFQKTPQISNFVKIRPAGTELCHVDGRTNRHEETNRLFNKERVFNESKHK